jgi:hypothetical protein
VSDELPSQRDDLWAWDRARSAEGDRPPRLVLLGKEFGHLLDLSYALRAFGLDARLVLARTGADPVFESLLAPAPDLLVILDHDTLYATGRLGSFLLDERIARLGIPVLLGRDLEVPAGCPVAVGRIAGRLSLDSFLAAASALLGRRLHQGPSLPRRSPPRAPVKPFAKADGSKISGKELRAELRGGRRPRILLLHDDVRFARRLRDEMAALHVDVWHSSTPFGLAVLPRHEPPDALVVSWEMWPGGANQLFKEWRQRRRFRELETAFVVSSRTLGQRDYRKAASQALSFRPLLREPFDATALYEVLRARLEDAEEVPWSARQALAHRRVDREEPVALKGAASLADVPRDYLRPITKALDNASHWVHGHTERVAHGLETRFVLDVLGDELHGRMKLHWETRYKWDSDLLEKLDLWSVTGFRRLDLEAELPPADDAITLRPDRGLRDLIERFRELKVGAPELDEAFIIHGDRQAGRLATAVQHHLLALRRHHVRLGIGAKSLVCQVDPFEGQPRVTGEIVSTLLLLWRELALVRLGHDPIG